MQEERRTPEIRFYGFTNDWEKCKLGEITESYSGGTPTVGVKKYYEGNIPFIRSAEINENHTELFISEEGLKKSSAKLVAPGDVLYALYGATAGEVGRAKLKGAINQAILDIIPNDEIDAEYIAQWLEKEKDWITGTYLQGGQGNLSGFIVKSLDVDIPQYEEQIQIGTFLKGIDNSINLQQQKYNQLVNMKQTLLEKMFPHDGAKSPEIRLAGFKDDWKLEKLGDYITECTDKTSDLSKYPLFSLTIEDGVTEKTERYERGFLVSKSGDLYKIVLPGCFVTNPMNLRFGAVGYNKKDDSVSVSGYYDVFSIDNNECSPFWNAYFKTEQMLKMFDDVATGSLLEKRRVHFSNLKDLKVIAPKEIAEKRGIGNIFLMVDNLISLQQLKLVQLKNIKQSFLDRMFVS